MLTPIALSHALPANGTPPVDRPASQRRSRFSCSHDLITRIFQVLSRAFNSLCKATSSVVARLFPSRSGTSLPSSTRPTPLEESSNPHPISEIPAQSTTRPLDRRICACLDQYTDAIYQQICASTPNPTLSPFSILCSLGLLLATVKPEKRSSILDKMGLSAYAYTDVLDTLKRRREIFLGLDSSGADVEISDIIATQEDVKIADQAQSALKDFNHKITVVRDDDVPTTVNRLVKEATHDLIPQLLDESKIMAATLANVIYFKGGWADSFEEQVDGSFNLSQDASVDAQFMTHSNLTCRLGAISEIGCRVLEIGYAKGFKHIVVLPDIGQSLPKLTTLDLARLTESLEHVIADISLPVTTTKSKITLDFLLMQLNLKPSDLDLTNINPDDRLEMVHEAVVKTSRAGTEATAATAISLKPMGMGNHTPTFIADRPFHFFIVKDQELSLNVLFRGTVCDAEHLSSV